MALQLLKDISLEKFAFAEGIENQQLSDVRRCFVELLLTDFFLHRLWPPLPLITIPRHPSVTAYCLPLLYTGHVAMSTTKFGIGIRL